MRWVVFGHLANSVEAVVSQAAILADVLGYKGKSSPSETGRHDADFLLSRLGGRLRYPGYGGPGRPTAHAELTIVPPKMCSVY